MTGGMSDAGEVTHDGALEMARIGKLSNVSDLAYWGRGMAY